MLNVNPLTVAINNPGAANAQTIVVQETTYTGVFSEMDTCNPSSGQLATIVTTNPAGPSANYTVTGVIAGTCSAIFSDSTNQHITVTITVTTSGFGIQSSQR